MVKSTVLNVNIIGFTSRKLAWKENTVPMYALLYNLTNYIPEREILVIQKTESIHTSVTNVIGCNA